MLTKNSLIQLEVEKIEKVTGKKMLNKIELATYLGICENDVTELINVGEIEAIKIGINTYVKVIDIAKFLSGESNNSNKNNNEKSIDFGLPQRYSSSLVLENLNEEEYDNMSRRGKGQGSVYFNEKRKVWQAAISLGFDENGKRRRKVISGIEKNDVLEAMNELMSSKATDKDKPQIDDLNINITFKEFLNNYLMNIKGGQQSRTFKNYIDVAKHLDEGLGSVKMCNLSKDDCQRFINGFTEKKYWNGKEEIYYGQSMIHKVYILLKMTLRDAAEKEIIKKNYMDYIKEPLSKKFQEPKYKALTDNEINDILQAVEDNLMLKTAIMIMTYTGLRPGEVYALKFNDFSFENKIISVNRALSYRQDVDIVTKKPIGGRIPIIKEIKNERGGKVESAKRVLGVSDKLLNAIKEWKEHLNTIYNLLEKRKKQGMEEFLFSGVKGQLVLLEYYGKVYKRHLQKKGLSSKVYNFYRFRHTLCTNLLKSGVPTKTVVRMMGDNSTKMVLDVYASIDKDDILKASSEYSTMMDEKIELISS